MFSLFIFAKIKPYFYAFITIYFAENDRKQTYVHLFRSIRSMSPRLMALSVTSWNRLSSEMVISAISLLLPDRH